MKNLEQFLADVKVNEDLREGVASCATEEEMDAFLAKAGYAVTSADFPGITDQKDLSDEELDAVAGGWDTDLGSGFFTAWIGTGAACWDD